MSDGRTWERTMDTPPHSQTMIFFFRRATAADSFAGYERLEAEAGVRQQL